MPDESHNKIENALKAYAKQRRAAAGEPLGMPSHTRAVLQREIAQRAAGAQPAPQRWQERLVALWPRLAVGAAAMTAAAIAMVVLIDISKKARPSMELAKAEPQAQSVTYPDRSGMAMDSAIQAETKLADNRGSLLAQSGAAGKAGQVSEERLKENDKLQMFGSLAKAKAAKAAPVEIKQQVAVTALPALAAKPSAAPAPMETDFARRTGMELADNRGLAVTRTKAVDEKPGAAPAAPAPMPAPTDVSKAERVEASRVVVAAASNMAPLSQRLRFAQIVSDQEMEPAKRPSEPQPQPQPQQPAVLASFQLEQIGDRVVIMDADGSVYEGRIQLASASQQQMALERRTSRSRRAPTRAAVPRQVMTQAGEFVWRERDATVSRRLESGSTGQQLFFTATGTNRSVNQRVVVNGVLSSPADGTLVHDPAAGGGRRMTFDSIPDGKMAVAAAPSARAALDSNAVPSKSGQLVLPAGTAAGPVPAMPQASAQIEGTLRIGNAPEVELNAVGVGP